MKPRILLILHLPPPTHGAGVVGLTIKRSEKINSEFDADFINLSTSKRINEVGHSGWIKQFQIMRLVGRVFSAVALRKYDLCYMTMATHGYGFYKDLLVVGILKVFRKKIIYHLHNKGVSKNQEHWMKNVLYKFAFSDTHSILLAPQLYADVKKYVKPARVLYCPNGVSDEVGVPVIATEPHLRRAPTLLFLSNMIVAKGVFILVDACKILANRSIEFRCDFVGAWSDVSEATFNDYVASSELNNYIVAHGEKYEAEKDRFFESADIFVHPTQNDAFPLVILEAMRFALPVVSTIEGGIPDIVLDNETGFLVEKADALALADKLEALITSETLRRKLGLAARRRYEDCYTKEKFERRIANILKSVL